MLKHRFLTALLLIPCVLGMLLYADLRLLYGLMVGLFGLCAWEWCALLPLTQKYERYRFVALLVAACALSVFCTGIWIVLSCVTWVFLAGMILTFPASQKLWGKKGWVFLFAMVILPAFFSALTALIHLPQGRYLILVLLVLVWAIDTGAYFAGKQWGRHRLIPRVSPGKTIEGSIGGFVVLWIAVFLIGQFLPFFLTMKGFILTTVTGIFAVFGDLFISMLKRRVTIKDTGTLLPGHGGVLDRLDSLFAAAPIFLYGIRLGLERDLKGDVVTIMNNFHKLLIAAMCCTATLLGSDMLFASSTNFIVKDIKVTGLTRVKLGTVLNYMPVQVGEEIGPSDTPQIIRALYDTGFFQSVVLERQGNTLIVQVVERSTIGSISVVGNKEIPDDKMKEILKELGLVKGRVFQRASLERLEKELKQAYNARGKYNARIESDVSDLTENRVAVRVNVSEGRVSRIKEIHLIGNHDFSDDELLPELALSSSSMFTYFTKKDQYSRAAMDASLESLRSFYLDRGYLKFKIISSQVLLSPDKKDVYINIHVHEGPQYRFSGFEVTGRTILPKDKIDALVKVKKGDVFSRKQVTETISDIGLALGDVGYGFPAINAEPQIDEKTKTVFINFVVDPGRHVYVRRINFHGNTRTADYVLRNIIRQDEGALLSLHNIKESERQLKLLNYIKDINVKTTPVSGANNQVDLDIQMEESPSSEASASAGYGSTGPQANIAVNQYNFLGTGRTVGFGFNWSYWGQTYSANYYNPFYTNTGVGRGIDVYYETVDPKKLDVAAYNSDRFEGDVNYSILLGEKTSLQLGYGYQNLQINNVGIVQQIQNFVNLYGRDFNQFRLTAGWNRNSFDQMPYPNRGLNQEAGVLIALPGTPASFTYYKAAYKIRYYQPLFKGFIATAMGNVGYGNTFNQNGLPFYENYYAGGIAQPGQVRGYDNYSLGPHDSNGRAMGANLLTNANAGIILPYPLSRDNVRTAVFMDAGNVFVRGTPVALAGVNAGPLRYSAGISVDWRSPFGPLAFSVAKALNPTPTDFLEVFQFTVSSGF